MFAKDDAKPVIPAKAKTEMRKGVIEIRDKNVADENRINIIARLRIKEKDVISVFERCRSTRSYIGV